MIFNGIDNQVVELKIINYQYPEINDKDWDGNWLNIYINVKSQFGNWQTTDPSLTTWEVIQLIEWFDDLSINKKPKWKDQEFTEPNLAFYVLNLETDDYKTIRISFNLECRPQNATDEIDYFVDVHANNNELKRISNDLRKELEKYPVRK